MTHITKGYVNSWAHKVLKDSNCDCLNTHYVRGCTAEHSSHVSLFSVGPSWFFFSFWVLLAFLLNEVGILTLSTLKNLFEYLCKAITYWLHKSCSINTRSTPFPIAQNTPVFSAIDAQPNDIGQIMSLPWDSREEQLFLGKVTVCQILPQEPELNLLTFSSL